MKQTIYRVGDVVWLDKLSGGFAKVGDMGIIMAIDEHRNNDGSLFQNLYLDIPLTNHTGDWLYAPLARWVSLVCRMRTYHKRQGG